MKTDAMPRQQTYPIARLATPRPAARYSQALASRLFSLIAPLDTKHPWTPRCLKDGLKLGLIGLIGYSPFFARDANADRVGVWNLSGTPGIGSSGMEIRHQEGGEIGFDSGDSTTWPERPIGSPPDWLSIYSDQWNQFYDVFGYNLIVDNRPYSGDYTNKIFPLRLDTQHEGDPALITSSNNYRDMHLTHVIQPVVVWGHG